MARPGSAAGGDPTRPRRDDPEPPGLHLIGPGALIGLSTVLALRGRRPARVPPGE